MTDLAGTSSTIFLLRIAWFQQCRPESQVGTQPPAALQEPGPLRIGYGVPSNIVPQIGMSLRVMGSTANGSASSTVKSARLPATMLPISRSMRSAKAASMVTAAVPARR